MVSKMKLNYLHTVRVCGASYLVQGILNNFLPLLFLRYTVEFGFSLNQISFLILANFGLQMIVDFISAKVVDRIGYRECAVASQAFSAIGLLGLTIFPYIFADAYSGILFSVLIYAIGSGLIETVGSPIVQACPIDNKDKYMSMIHSFYCWGHVLVVIASTCFFKVFGMNNWRVLSALWAVVPFVIMFLFMKVPICSLAEEGKTLSGRHFIKMPVFWILIVLMFCSGASEQGISQWISTFAEAGLGIDKTTGDLLGTCMFAVLMGSSRVFYGKLGHKFDINKYMLLSGSLCFVCYFVAGVSESAVVSLIACILCGTTVGIMWPGIYNVSTDVIRNGGTGLFAYLALAGDMGCAGGPGILGIVAELFNENLKAGMIVSSLFPIAFVVLFFVLLRSQRR